MTHMRNRFVLVKRLYCIELISGLFRNQNVLDFHMLFLKNLVIQWCYILLGNDSSSLLTVDPLTNYTLFAVVAAANFSRAAE